MHKIKRNSSIYYNNTQHKKRRIATIILVIVLVLLGFVGYCLFDPVSEFIDNMANRISVGDDDIIIAESSSNTEVSSSQVEDTSSSLSQELEDDTQSENTEDEQVLVSGDFEICAKYISPDILKDDDKLTEFINLATSTGVNSVLIEVKDITGSVLYISELAKVNEAKAVSLSAVDLKPVLEKLKQNGIKPIALMSAFEDSIASHKFRDIAVSYTENNSWLWYDNSPDSGGKPWLNANSEGAQNYILDIAVECADIGFDAIIMHKVQFPEGVSLNLAQTGVANDGKSAVLSGFIKSVQTELSSRGVELILADDYNKFTTAYDFQLGGTLSNLGALTVSPYINIDNFIETMQIGDKVYENPAENTIDIVREILKISSNSYKADILPIITSNKVAELEPLLKELKARGYIILDNNLF